MAKNELGLELPAGARRGRPTADQGFCEAKTLLAFYIGELLTGLQGTIDVLLLPTTCLLSADLLTLLLLALTSAPSWLSRSPSAISLAPLGTYPPPWPPYPLLPLLTAFPYPAQPSCYLVLAGPSSPLPGTSEYYPAQNST
ncbi:hypothetical protein GCM10023172_42140 [Hymenobacter ginsengisoli]|uniref:Uncharacterized protein n=1 Tax=Hymenobacter ginsengisoli TaxID=1051626 RepID=A0ABP8QRQ8_9BACT